MHDFQDRVASCLGNARAFLLNPDFLHSCSWHVGYLPTVCEEGGQSLYVLVMVAAAEFWPGI